MKGFRFAVVLVSALLLGSFTTQAFAVDRCHQAQMQYEAAKADANRWIRNHPGVNLAWAEQHHPVFSELMRVFYASIQRRNHECR